MVSAFVFKEELLDGILGNDLLGFHLRLDCQNFLDTVDHTFEARVDRERFEVTRNRKATTVRPFPISIDFAEYTAVAKSHQTQKDEVHWRRELGLTDRHLVGVGVDRIDYTKGILERFGALDRLLTECPQYRERLVFVQIGVPSRSRIREYQNLEDEIDARCDEINWRWAVGPGFNFVVGVEQRKGLLAEVKIGALDSPGFKLGIGWSWPR